MLSVVILNFNRPEFIKNNIIPKITKSEYIDQIIISNGKKETALNLQNITCLDHYEKINQEYGLSRRFLSALEAKNNHIMIMDDDIIPSIETIQFLLEKLEEDPQRIYGIYGRNIDKNNGYEYTNVFGTVPIVLTRCLVCTKEMCKYFIDNFRKYESEEVKKSKPYWNGEDILFSLLSIKKYDKLPIAYDMEHYNRLVNYINVNEAISFDKKHAQYRKEIANYFIDKLTLQNKIIRDTKIEKERTQLGYFSENSNLSSGFFSFNYILNHYDYMLNKIKNSK